jgi:hypothetical protein
VTQKLLSGPSRLRTSYMVDQFIKISKQLKLSPSYNEQSSSRKIDRDNSSADHCNLNIHHHVFQAEPARKTLRLPPRTRKATHTHECVRLRFHQCYVVSSSRGTYIFNSTYPLLWYCRAESPVIHVPRYKPSQRLPTLSLASMA